MKRVLIMVIVLMVSTAGLFAQQAGQWTVGGRLGMVFGFNNPADIGGLIRGGLI